MASVRKICLNCGGDWDKCFGHKCLTLDGACCIDFCEKDMNINSFGYKILREEGSIKSD